MLLKAALVMESVLSLFAEDLELTQVHDYRMAALLCLVLLFNLRFDSFIILSIM
jgi:hypothetical protein